MKRYIIFLKNETNSSNTIHAYTYIWTQLQNYSWTPVTGYGRTCTAVPYQTIDHRKIGAKMLFEWKVRHEDTVISLNTLYLFVPLKSCFCIIILMERTEQKGADDISFILSSSE